MSELPYTPILNVIQFDRELWEQFTQEFLLHCGGNGGRAVERHANVLGRPGATFTGFKRYMVWENSLEGWRVYVNNVKGVCFEVEERLSPKGALMAWHNYLRHFEGKR